MKKIILALVLVILVQIDVFAECVEFKSEELKSMTEIQMKDACLDNRSEKINILKKATEKQTNIENIIFAQNQRDKCNKYRDEIVQVYQDRFRGGKPMECF